MAATERGGPFSIAAFDVDGTLVDASGVIDREAVSVIGDLENRGIEVIIATARGPSGVVGVVEAIGADVWAITYQGALVGHFQDGRWSAKSQTTIDLDDAHDIAGQAAEMGLVTSWHNGSSWWTSDLSDEIEREAYIVGDSPEVVPDMRRLTVPPHKLMFISPPDEIEKLTCLVERLSPAVSHSYSHPNYVEVSPARIDKGTALRDLLQRIGRDAGSLVAFGDGENDLPMFELAALSVAMAHSLPSVRRAADAEAADGLASALRQIKWR